MAIDDLVGRARDGSQRALGRLLSIAEAGGPRASELDSLSGTGTHAHIVGLTGSPGVGKSTLTSALLEQLQNGGRRIAVVAVDPTSPRSGGAILGDRIRIQPAGLAGGTFVRSVASRGALGGLSISVRRMLRVLEASAFTMVILETVGVGQIEIDIAAVADTVVMVLAPGWGDGVQAEKAGLLEVADVFVVNKADRDGLDATLRDLRGMLALGSEVDWTPPIISTVATTCTGVDKLVAAIEQHAEFLAAGDRLSQRRFRGRQNEVSELALERLKAMVERAVANTPEEGSVSEAVDAALAQLGVTLRAQ